MSHIKKIDHIAIATDDLEKSLQFYQDSLGLECISIEEIAERGLKIAFLPIGDLTIELLSPLHEASEISSFLAKKGPGLHHIAFESTNIRMDMAEMSALEIPFTSSRPRPGAHHSQVAFIHPQASNKVLIELVEKSSDDRKRVLGVDLGLKRTGLAVSDELGLTTRALANLIPKSRSEDISTLLNLCQQLEVGTVVFGLPLRSGSAPEGPLAHRFRAFAQAFQLQSDQQGMKLAIVMLDEARSSKNAAQRLAASGVAVKKRQNLLDGEAARILVEDYLATQGAKKK